MRAVFWSWFAALVAMTGVLSGCQTLERDSSPKPPVAGNLETRNNAASLLYDLLEDEKQLSKILLIKRETDELDRLVKGISSFAAAGVKELNQMRKADPSLDLKAVALPSGEVATREAISKTKANSLLHSSGTDFEFNLLLTQVQALNYGAHLARIAAATESSAERSRQFSDLGAEMQRLYDQTIGLLHARAAPASRR
jgi:hypothetical protein